VASDDEQSAETEVQSAVDDLANLLHRSVVIIDPDVRLLYSSVHFGDEDQVRIKAILHRGADSKAIGHVLAQGVTNWHTAGVIPANPELEFHARVCVPIRWRGTLFGMVLVMDADGTMTTSELAASNKMAQDVAPAMAIRGEREAAKGVPERTVPGRGARGSAPERGWQRRQLLSWWFSAPSGPSTARPSPRSWRQPS